jgi:hypothetical protein
MPDIGRRRLLFLKPVELFIGIRNCYIFDLNNQNHIIQLFDQYYLLNIFLSSLANSIGLLIKATFGMFP